MHPSKIVYLINDHVRSITGIYEEGGKPQVFKSLDSEIKVGDFCVVQSSTRFEMTVFKVTETDTEINLEDDEEVRWVVQRIDIDAFETVVTKEKQAIETVQAAERNRKKAELRASLFKNHESEVKKLKLADMSENSSPNDVT